MKTGTAFRKIAERMGLAALAELATEPLPPVEAPPSLLRLDLPTLLDLGKHDASVPGFFEQLSTLLPPEVEPLVARDRNNTLVTGALSLPMALEPTHPLVEVAKRVYSTIGDVDTLVEALNGARLFSLASAFGHAAAATELTVARLTALVEVVLDAGSVESLPPRRFESVPEDAETAGLAEYFSYRHGLIHPEARAGLGSVSGLLGELRELSGQAVHPRADVALTLLHRGSEPAKQAERVVSLARTVGRTWRFGAVVTAILSCKAFPNDSGMKRLDAHLERFGSDEFLWRELFADATGEFALALRRRLLDEIQRYPTQRALWRALGNAPGVDRDAINRATSALTDGSA